MTISEIEVEASINGLFGTFVVVDDHGFPVTYKLAGAPYGSWLEKLGDSGQWQLATSQDRSRVMPPLRHKLSTA